MKFLLVTIFACVTTITSASVIGTHVNDHGGAIVSGPSGVITRHGNVGLLPSAIGHVGVIGHETVISSPVVHGVVVDHVVSGYGIGHHGVISHGIVGQHAVITNGGGVVSSGHHGAVVEGPRTVPVIVSGPSGKIASDGLWGATLH